MGRQEIIEQELANMLGKKSRQNIIEDISKKFNLSHETSKTYYNRWKTKINRENEAKEIEKGVDQILDIIDTPLKSTIKKNESCERTITQIEEAEELKQDSNAVVDLSKTKEKNKIENNKSLNKLQLLIKGEYFTYEICDKNLRICEGNSEIVNKQLIREMLQALRLFNKIKGAKM